MLERPQRRSSVTPMLLFGSLRCMRRFETRVSKRTSPLFGRLCTTALAAPERASAGSDEAYTPPHKPHEDDFLPAPCLTRPNRRRKINACARDVTAST
jgi:hypothetical protein